MRICETDPWRCALRPGHHGMGVRTGDEQYEKCDMKLRIHLDIDEQMTIEVIRLIVRMPGIDCDC